MTRHDGAALAVVPPMTDDDETSVPNLSGDLEEILGRPPAFRHALRGYDRLQVDNFVSWTETELLARRREVADLVQRYGRCSAELEISSRLLAGSSQGREMTRVSERIGTMLRLAADEAADLTAAARAEAQQLVADARVEADGVLRRAGEVRDLALAERDRLALENDRLHREAQAALEEARAQSDQLLSDAAGQRERLDGEAAQAREQAATELAGRLAEAGETARVQQEAAAAAAAAALEDLRRENLELDPRGDPGPAPPVRRPHHGRGGPGTVAPPGGGAA